MSSTQNTKGDFSLKISSEDETPKQTVIDPNKENSDRYYEAKRIKKEQIDRLTNLINNPENTIKKAFSDSNLGITFEYPASFGEIGQVQQPHGISPREIVEQGKEGIPFYYLTLSNFFGSPRYIAITDGKAGLGGDRGLSWEDDALGLNKEKVESVCKWIDSGEYDYKNSGKSLMVWGDIKKCTISQNTHGITVAKVSFSPIYPSPGPLAAQYYLFNPKNELSSIVITSQTIIERGDINNFETILDEMVDSIKFLP